MRAGIVECLWDGKGSMAFRGSQWVGKPVGGLACGSDTAHHVNNEALDPADEGGVPAMALGVEGGEELEAFRVCRNALGGSAIGEVVANAISCGCDACGYVGGGGVPLAP